MSDFEEFKEKREQWIQELCVVSQRNIRDQLSAIARDIATFKMILKAVDLAPETDREGFKKLNPLLFDMHRDGNGRIVHWFASYITLNIRKLGEDGYLEHSGNGHDRSVRSLTALLNDMKDNSQFVHYERICYKLKAIYPIKKTLLPETILLLKSMELSHHGFH